VGSTPTPGFLLLPTYNSELLGFALWLFKKGNRESTIHRKLKILKYLKGNIEDMYHQILASKWSDGTKEYGLITVQQYADYKGLKIPKPEFRVYHNSELYVPNPTMVKELIYRISNVKLRAMCLIAIETGATEGEVFNLKWKDVNLANKTIVITGVKGHRTYQYPISDELCTLLMQIPRNGDRIFTLKNSRTINDWLKNYVKKLAKETGNNDFLKIHFHTLRHFAISWHYFKTKDVVDTQRFARHCRIENTLKYVHIIKQWISENEYDVVYANNKEELTQYLAEGYELLIKSEWGYCLRRPKTFT